MGVGAQGEARGCRCDDQYFKHMYIQIVNGTLDVFFTNLNDLLCCRNNYVPYHTIENKKYMYVLIYYAVNLLWICT